MERFKLATILLENNPRSLSYPSMYCRSTAPVVWSRDEGIWELVGPGVFDFTTYFNALSVAKLKRYTVAGDFYLHLELKGGACEFVQTWAGAYSWNSEVLEDTRVVLDASSEWQVLDVKIDLQDKATLQSFMLTVDSLVQIRNSYFTTEVDPAAFRSVELALATTTFKKEDFIEPNIALLKEHILASDDPIAQHFHMHVVDNGRTLDAEALSCSGVTVYPNDNVGGAGGFARGMIEAMRSDPPATHVLIMDDDVAVSPESIKRTYNLLCLLNDEYKDAFISGAMMNYEVGEDQWEDLGYMTEGGFCRPVKGPLRMSLLHDIVVNEEVKLTPEQHQTYAAWWYCCIPVSTIKREGLPLPVFVRYDDVEYGLRCKPKFITMNGICIWHLSFHSRYNAAVERYQTTRNAFIAQATTGMAPDSDFLKELNHNIQVELKKYNYTNAELALKGFEDFLKGPDFISQPVAEKCFMDANKEAEKLVSFDELRKQTADIEGFNFDEITCPDIYSDEPRTKGEAFIDYLTFNGQRTFLAKAKDEKATVIPANGWAYPAGKIRDKAVLVAIDPDNRKGVVRRIDRDRFKEVMARYKADLKFYKQNRDRLEAEYRAARSMLTSEDFWKGYLGIS